MALGIAIGGGLITGYITSREWFEPVPVEYLFHDRHHFADCIIEHEELHILKDQMNQGVSGNKSESKVLQASSGYSQVVAANNDDAVKVKPSIN